MQIIRLMLRRIKRIKQEVAVIHIRVEIFASAAQLGLLKWIDYVIDLAPVV
jgi:hypothetical protein